MLDFEPVDEDEPGAEPDLPMFGQDPFGMVPGAGFVVVDDEDEDEDAASPGGGPAGKAGNRAAVDAELAEDAGAFATAVTATFDFVVVAVALDAVAAPIPRPSPAPTTARPPTVRPRRFVNILTLPP